MGGERGLLDLAGRRLTWAELQPHRVVHALFALLWIGHAGHLIQTDYSTAAATDSSGYMNSAKMLSRGGFSAPVRSIAGVPSEALDPRLLAPLGCKPGQAPGTIAPEYAVGYPLHLLLAHYFVGWARAGVLVNILASLAFLLSCYLIGWRLGLPWSWSLAVGVVLTVCPLYLDSFKGVMSDALATTWCAVAVLTALLARQRYTWAAVAGLALGFAVLVRATDVMLAPALAFALPWDRRAWGAFVLAGLPAAIFLALYNHGLYGSATTTGYGSISGEFSWTYVWPRLVFIAEWLARFFGPLLVLALPVAVARAAWHDRRHQLLLIWAGGIIGFYGFYNSTLSPDWFAAGLRFVLPSFAPLLLAAALVAFDGYRRWLAWRGAWRPARPLALALLFLFGVVWPLTAQTKQNVELRLFGYASREERAAAKWLNDELPPNAAVLADGASGEVFFYTERPLLEFDFLDPRTFTAIGRAAEVPLYAYLRPWEIDIFRQRVGGSWTPVASRGPYHLWQFTGGSPPPLRGAGRDE